MKRMVVIATMGRGAVEPHEPVGAQMEAKMFERMFAEAACADARVEWRTEEPRKLPPPRFKPNARQERLMQLARKAG